MKKIILLLILIFSINVYASGGTLKQNSIIECNGQYFGNHGNPLHWHKAKKINDIWVTDGEEVDVPNCYIKTINTFEVVKFSKCIDGDTAKLLINNEEKTVRFLAINTPEIDSSLKTEEPFGKEASEYTCNSLKKAKKITLEYDSNSDKVDKYGRVLAFVYVDDELLEMKLIERGLAKVDYIYGDYAHIDELRKVENIAREGNIGIWENNNGDITINEENKKNNTIWQIIYYILQIIYLFITKIFA